MVPSGSEEWRDSIMQPMQYAVAPAFSGLAELMQQEHKDRSRTVWQTALRQEVERIAGLTAIDGTTIISDRYELLGFGGKIKRGEDKALVDQVIMTEPIIGGGANVVSPSQTGGTRHLSAAQFVHDQRDALALVASQDGRFTVFSWSKDEDLLYAHRVDSLLM